MTQPRPRVQATPSPTSRLPSRACLQVGRPDHITIAGINDLGRHTSCPKGLDGLSLSANLSAREPDTVCGELPFLRRFHRRRSRAVQSCSTSVLACVEFLSSSLSSHPIEIGIGYPICGGIGSGPHRFVYFVFVGESVTPFKAAFVVAIFGGRYRLEHNFAQARRENHHREEQ
jgi:multidrug transporter EmrE-like cation transporter